ncbi:hypothetical protein SESBI_38400, partial [Sesbania bispinosa]
TVAWQRPIWPRTWWSLLLSRLGNVREAQLGITAAGRFCSGAVKERLRLVQAVVVNDVQGCCHDAYGG